MLRQPINQLVAGCWLTGDGRMWDFLVSFSKNAFETIQEYGCPPKNRGGFYPPKWMVKNNGSKPYVFNGWFGGTIIFGNTHIQNMYLRVSFWNFTQ